jgi:hypothetical protein
MNRIRAASASLFCFLLLPTSALADAIDPYAYACQGKDAGDTCTVAMNCGSASNCADEHGSCLGTTCSRLDYQHWDRDASSTPPVDYYPCLVCNADGGVAWFPEGGTPDAASSHTAGGGDDPAGYNEAGAAGDGELPDGSPEGRNGSNSQGSNAGATNAGGSSGGCSIGAVSPENMIAAWVLACAVPVALSRVRRKKP